MSLVKCILAVSRAAAMRILMISRNLPYPPLSGEQIRIFHFLRGLSANHEVTLLTRINDPSERDLAENLKDCCKEIHTVVVPFAPLPLRVHATGLFSRTPYYSVVMPSPGLQPQLFALLGSRPYDLIQVENLAAAHWVAPLRGVVKIIDMHNVDSTYFRRQIKYLRLGVRELLMVSDAIKLPCYQRKIISRFDRCLAVSEVDAKQLGGLVLGARVSVVSNGVDVQEFHPWREREEPNSLVFAGSFPYLPNVDAAIFFCRKIIPLIRRAVSGLRIFIVGQAPPPEVEALSRSPGVTVTGRVPDIRPYFARATVVVVPLRLGSGTRLKILQAMAMGKGIVSTSIGAEGLNVRPGHDIEIADRAEEFAEKTVTLLRDSDRRMRLGAHARQTTLREYAWTKIITDLEEVYNDVRPRAQANFVPAGG